jgi:hypothetical protein
MLIISVHPWKSICEEQTYKLHITWSKNWKLFAVTFPQDQSDTCV